MSETSQQSEIRTREWLLIIATITLVHYVINTWSVEFGNSKEILDKVSFAGTIVSILLAISAIIYSYFQGSNQAAESRLVINSISNLSTAIDTLKSTQSELAKTLDKIEEIKNSLKSVEGKVDNLMTKESSPARTQRVAAYTEDPSQEPTLGNSSSEGEES